MLVFAPSGTNKIVPPSVKYPRKELTIRGVFKGDLRRLVCTVRVNLFLKVDTKHYLRKQTVVMTRDLWRRSLPAGHVPYGSDLQTIALSTGDDNGSDTD